MGRCGLLLLPSALLWAAVGAPMLGCEKAELADEDAGGWTSISAPLGLRPATDGRTAALAWVDSIGLGNAWDVAVLASRGAVAVLDAADGQVRWMEGPALFHVGRTGSGPGELRAPVAMAVRGDTMAVLDRQGRVVVFDLAGRQPLWEVVCRPSALYPALALLADGSLVLPAAGPDGWVGERFWPDGRTEPWGQVQKLERGSDYTLNLAASVGHRVVVADNHGGRLLVFSASGELEISLSLPHSVREPINASLEAMRAEGREVVGNPHILGLQPLGGGRVFVHLLPVRDHAVGLVADLDAGDMRVVEARSLRDDEWQALRSARALRLHGGRLYALARNGILEFDLVSDLP